MSQYNALLLENDLNKSDVQRSKACGACGTLLILGWAATMEIKTQRKKPKGKIASNYSRAMVYRCATCNMKTQFPIQSAPKIISRPGVVSKIANQEPSTPISLQASTHKKRSKSAKQGGLRALLQKKKENNLTSSGFDLMDFMKSG